MVLLPRLDAEWTHSTPVVAVLDGVITEGMRRAGAGGA
jgi:hypothetical protein